MNSNPRDFGEALAKNPTAVRKFQNLTEDGKQAVNLWANELETAQEMDELVQNIADASEHDYC